MPWLLMCLFTDRNSVKALKLWGQDNQVAPWMTLALSAAEFRATPVPVGRDRSDSLAQEM